MKKESKNPGIILYVFFTVLIIATMIGVPVIVWVRTDVPLYGWVIISVITLVVVGKVWHTMHDDYVSMLKHHRRITEDK